MNLKCVLCSELLDPLCEECYTSTTCSKCMSNYRWDGDLKRCIPDIKIVIKTISGNSESIAISDTYQITITIPSVFISSAINLGIYAFDSIEIYENELKSLIQ